MHVVTSKLSVDSRAFTCNKYPSNGETVAEPQTESLVGNVVVDLAVSSSRGLRVCNISERASRR
jgi:hypothetical protein